MKSIQDKKAQLHLSFEMIFALFIIAVFLVVAFFVVRHFLEVQRCADVGLFVRSIQESVDEVWQSQEASTLFERDMPSSIDYACFADLNRDKNMHGLTSGEEEKMSKIYNDLGAYFKHRQANFFFYPWQSACNMPAHDIKHINISDISRINNPLCFSAVDGKVNIKLSKNFDDILVGISR